MKSLVFLLLAFVITLPMSCGSAEDPAKSFRIEIDGKTKKFNLGQSVGIKLVHKKSGESVENADFYLDDIKLDNNNGKITISSPTLGNKSLMAKTVFDEQPIEIKEKIKILASNAPKVYTYNIVNTYPHDIEAFTQGLEFKNDTLFESTGSPGAEPSLLRKLNFKTGEVYKEIELKNDEFGEGLTLINGKVMQLTWRSGIGYVYDHDLNEESSFVYGKSKEGWGLCNDGQKIFKSDGTEKIWILDPETLAETGYIETVTNKSIFNKANELEYVEGKIYANVWQKESVMIIDVKTGAIIGVVNFSGLKNKVTKHEKLDVLNGIAYHPERKTFFVTGKRWDKLFEVEIVEK